MAQIEVRICKRGICPECGRFVMVGQSHQGCFDRARSSMIQLESADVLIFRTTTVVAD